MATTLAFYIFADYFCHWLDIYVAFWWVLNSMTSECTSIVRNGISVMSNAEALWVMPRLSCAIWQICISAKVIWIYLVTMALFGYMASSGYYWVYWNYSFAACLLICHRSFWMLRQSVLRIHSPPYKYSWQQQLWQLQQPIAGIPPRFTGFLAFQLWIFVLRHTPRTSIYMSIDPM